MNAPGVLLKKISIEYIQVFLNTKIIKFLQKIYQQEIKNRKSIKLYKSTII